MTDKELDFKIEKAVDIKLTQVLENISNNLGAHIDENENKDKATYLKGVIGLPLQLTRLSIGEEISRLQDATIERLKKELGEKSI